MRRDPLDIDVTPPGLRRRSGRALAVAACCALSAIARAADDEVALAIRPPPLIERILPPAARSGGTVRLRIEGKRLDGIESLVASHEGIRAERIVEPPSESEIEDAKNGTARRRRRACSGI